MKPNCPGCDALRREAARLEADLGDLLMRAALHEASPQCRNKRGAPRDTKPAARKE
ncbi:hypothetical protein [Streptomyces sp. NPDC059819]|uniref:hypothetical protein n=1 Tax=Streptomyces sp. NPDC059819 TaxID=3346963 RepID=UPI0036608C2F